MEPGKVLRVDEPIEFGGSSPFKYLAHLPTTWPRVISRGTVVGSGELSETHYSIKFVQGRRSINQP